MKARLVILWVAVSAPLLWGVFRALLNAMQLFH